MSATIAIQALLADMPVGKVFTTNDVLGLGSRSAVDKCLQRLVKNKTLTRLAWGVFSYGSEKPSITPLELAQIKARAFHKDVSEHPSTTAGRLGYVARDKSKGSEPLVFATNGSSSSSFQSIFGTIQLKATSARKRHEHRDEVWEMLKSLWHVGKNGISTRIWDRIKLVWGRQSQEKFLRYSGAIPQWLVERFPRDLKRSLQLIHVSLATNTPGVRTASTASIAPGPVNAIAAFSSRLALDTRVATESRTVFNSRAAIKSRAAVKSPAIRSGASESAKDNCWCPPDLPDCVCPMFSCGYCQSKPIINRFSMALG